MRTPSASFSALDIAAKLVFREALFTTAVMTLAREYSVRKQGRSSPAIIADCESVRDTARANLYAARPALYTMRKQEANRG